MYFMTAQRRIVSNKSILRLGRALASTKAELYKVSFDFALGNYSDCWRFSFFSLCLRYCRNATKY